MRYRFGNIIGYEGDTAIMADARSTARVRVGDTLIDPSGTGEHVTVRSSRADFEGGCRTFVVRYPDGGQGEVHAPLDGEVWVVSRVKRGRPGGGR